jgi:hypothetical protein
MEERNKVIKVKHNRSTVLMGDGAELKGSLRALPVEHGAKHFHVTQWKSIDDSFTWKVETDKSGEYLITLLISGFESEVELKCGDIKLTTQVNYRWDRRDIGSIYLKEGLNLITLKALQVGRDLELYSVELLPIDIKPIIEKRVMELRSNTQWMRDAKYGIQFHWTSLSQPRYGVKKPYAEAVQDFNVEAFASMVYETGAGYVTFTTSHAEYYFPAPIQAIDRIMPGRTTQRDLIQELIEALGAYNIRLILYYNPGHEHWQEPDGWWKRIGFDPENPTIFFEHWCAIIEEIGKRYRSGLAGWFFDDGCVYYPLNLDFERMTLAAKAGNPNRVICYNSWIWPRFTDFQDYFCGEGYNWLYIKDYLPQDGSGIFTGGPQKGLQAHANFILESRWCHDLPNTPIPPPQIPKEKFLEDIRAAVSRGIVPSVNLEIYQDGTISPLSMEYMKALKELVKNSI